MVDYSKRIVMAWGMALLSVQANSVEVDRDGWRQECVGALAVEMPPDLEVATVPSSRLLTQLRGQPGRSKFRFGDGEAAGWSSLRYIGEIFVTDNLRPNELSEIKAQFVKSKLDYTKYLYKVPLKAGQKVSVTDVFPARPDAIGWSVDDQARLLVQKNGHVLTMTLPKKLASFYSTTIKYRPIYSLPSAQELCLPFVSIPLTPSRERDVAVTYRLISHPDVTIMISDSNAVEYQEPIPERNSEFAVVIANFWAQYEMGKSIDQLLKPASSRISIDGRGGMESFVKITRENGGDDYGYFAMVRGRYGADPEEATVQVYVLRNAERSLSKGGHPLGKTEFLQLARDIVGSIRSRSLPRK